MVIYELEERIYFDGAMPADIAEVEDTSCEELEDTAENTDSVETDNSENVSIAPETDNTNSDDNSGDDDSDSDDDLSDNSSSDPASIDSIMSYDPNNIAAIIDAIDEVTITDDTLLDQNFLIIYADNENLDEITDPLNDNTTLIIYDSNDTFDSIIQKLKDELGYGKAVNIGIFDSEKIIDNGEKCNDFLDELKDLQYFDGEINILDFSMETAGGIINYDTLTIIS